MWYQKLRRAQKMMKTCEKGHRGQCERVPNGQIWDNLSNKINKW